MVQTLGQNRALEILDNAVRSRRIHHAWIFSGPRGVGKFTAAVELAKVLLDPEPSNVLDQIHNPASKVQNLIEAGTHPDLHIIRKELAKFSDDRIMRDKKLANIPIGLLRELVIGGMVGDGYCDAPAYRTPQLGHGKVFIIDEAEMLDEFGQNAMLKTLEEPPPQTYFFLITHQPDRLLATIRSRCQLVQFGRLDDDTMEQWLERTIEPANRTASGTDNEIAEIVRSADRTALVWVKQFAEGSPGVALLALKYGFFNWKQTLEPMLAELDHGKFPVAMGDALGGFVEEFAKSWVSQHGKNASKEAANKDGAKHVLSLLAAHARRHLHAASTSMNGTAEQWLDIIDLIREAERQLESRVNVKHLMENLVVQWAQVTTPVAAA